MPDSRIRIPRVTYGTCEAFVRDARNIEVMTALMLTPSNGSQELQFVESGGAYCDVQNSNGGNGENN